MRAIWKFELPVTDEADVDMPYGAEILTVESASTYTLNVWAVVDPGAGTGPRRFSIRGTGHPLGEVGEFVGMATDGRFVWHVFVGAEQP